MSDNPPEQRIGSRAGHDAAGTLRRHEVEVWEMGHGPPQVALHIATNAHTSPACGDSWFLEPDEARQIAALLVAAATAARAGAPGVAGTLHDSSPRFNGTWLLVAAVIAPSAMPAPSHVVQLKLDSILTRADARDGSVYFTPAAARAFARLLLRAADCITPA